MILDIIKWTDKNNSILRNKNLDIEKGSDLNKLVSDMFETTKKYNGVGLSAPQIGVNKNLFVVNYKNIKQEFLNPVIEVYGSGVLMSEGCLSVPNIQISVNRKDKVKISFYDSDWNFHKKEFKNEVARIIQHEYDHLIGKLIVD